MFFETVWGKADALFFLRGRLFFHHVTGERAKYDSGAPSVLVAYGSSNADCLKAIGLPGVWVGAKDVMEIPQNNLQIHVSIKTCHHAVNRCVRN